MSKFKVKYRVIFEVEDFEVNATVDPLDGMLSLGLLELADPNLGRYKLQIDTVKDESGKTIWKREDNEEDPEEVVFCFPR